MGTGRDGRWLYCIAMAWRGCRHNYITFSCLYRRRPRRVSVLGDAAGRRASRCWPLLLNAAAVTPTLTSEPDDELPLVDATCSARGETKRLPGSSSGHRRLPQGVHRPLVEAGVIASADQTPPRCRATAATSIDALDKSVGRSPRVAQTYPPLLTHRLAGRQIQPAPCPLRVPEQLGPRRPR